MSTTLPTESPQKPRLAVLRKFPVRVVALVVVLGLVGFAGGYLGVWPPVATVMSGSMAPTIKTGDVVVLKRVTGGPKVGDVVKVAVPDEARSRYGYPPVVIHRVVRLNFDGTISTKGDAKPRPDPFTVRRDAASAKVVFDIPAAGRVLAFLTSPMGLLWIAGGVLMFFVLPLFERREEADRAEQEALAAMRAELHTITEELVRLRTEPVIVEPGPEPEPEPEPEPVLEEEPVQAEPEPAEEEAMPFVAAPTIDWLDLETEDESDLMPHWPEPPEFLPDYVPVGRDRTPPAAQPEPASEPEPATYVVRRRSGGLLARLR